MGNHKKVIKYTRGGTVIKAVGYLADCTISVKSKGLLSIMEHTGRAMTLEELLHISKDGYTSLQRGLQELSANGYYYSKPIRDNKGKFIRFEQRVRFAIHKPEVYCEKNIINAFLSSESLNETELYVLESSVDALSSDLPNYKIMLAEGNDYLYLGYPNAKTVTEMMSRKKPSQK